MELIAKTSAESWAKREEHIPDVIARRQLDLIVWKSKAFFFFLNFICLSIYLSIFNEHTLAPWDFVHESEHKAFEIHSIYSFLGVNTLEISLLSTRAWLIFWELLVLAGAANPPCHTMNMPLPSITQGNLVLLLSVYFPLSPYFYGSCLSCSCPKTSRETTSVA